MGKLKQFLGIAMCIYALHQVHGEEKGQEIQKLSQEFDSLVDLFDCVNYTCTMCAKWSGKYKVCNIAGIIEKNYKGKTDLTIQYNITVNNNLILSELYNLSRLPELCYNITGVTGCLKLSFKKVNQELEGCGTLRISLGDYTLPEYDLYCLLIPSGNRPGRLVHQLKGLQFDENLKELKSKRDLNQLHQEMYRLGEPRHIPYVWVNGLKENADNEKSRLTLQEAMERPEFASVNDVRSIPDLNKPQRYNKYRTVRSENIPRAVDVSPFGINNRISSNRDSKLDESKAQSIKVKGKFIQGTEKSQLILPSEPLNVDEVSFDLKKAYEDYQKKYLPENQTPKPTYTPIPAIPIPPF